MTAIHVIDIVESDDVGRVERQRTFDPTALDTNAQSKIANVVAAMVAWLEANVPHDSQ